MSVVRVRVHRGPRHRDLVVDAELAVAELLPWLCQSPVAGLCDGERRLDLAGPGLAAQGVVDGADLRLHEVAPETALDPAST